MFTTCVFKRKGKFRGCFAALPLVAGEVVAADQGSAPRAGPLLGPVRAGPRRPLLVRENGSRVGADDGILGKERIPESPCLS